MKYLLLLAAVAFFIAGCSTDPLNQPYNEPEGVQALYNARPRLDPRIMDYIMEAINTNERNGVSSEGKTFKELAAQGRELWVQRKASGIVDSTKQKNGYK